MILDSGLVQREALNRAQRIVPPPMSPVAEHPLPAPAGSPSFRGASVAVGGHQRTAWLSGADAIDPADAGGSTGLSGPRSSRSLGALAYSSSDVRRRGGGRFGRSGLIGRVGSSLCRRRGRRPAKELVVLFSTKAAARRRRT